MFKKNSILDRPIRPPSARNRESAPEEHEADLARQRRLQGRFKRYDAFDVGVEAGL